VCTFVFAWQVFEEASIVVAANRDERLGRESRPPRVLDEEPRVIAPQDLTAEGTWIGYNEHDLFASVTNRWIDAELAGERSRGLLVSDALARETADEAIAFVEDQVSQYEYEGFNLVVIDEERAALCAWDGDLEITGFDPGVHIVINVGADETFAIPESRATVGREQAARTERALSDLQPEPAESPETWLGRTTAVLRDHDYGFCVHGDGFGTRSSSLLTLYEDGRVEHRFANGPPCENTYEPAEASL
jgi:uncharacterized protein with NRDE domain